MSNNVVVTPNVTRLAVQADGTVRLISVQAPTTVRVLTVSKEQSGGLPTLGAEGTVLKVQGGAAVFGALDGGTA